MAAPQRMFSRLGCWDLLLRSLGISVAGLEEHPVGLWRVRSVGPSTSLVSKKNKYIGVCLMESMSNIVNIYIDNCG